MRRWLEFSQYVAISAGMALAASCYAVVGGLFSVSTGSGALLAIVVAGMLCAVVSTAIAELASRFPSAPGINTYLKSAFGESVALAITFVYVSLVAMLAGVESFVFSEVVGHLYPEIPPHASAVLLVAGVVTTNLLGLEMPRNLQLVVTALLLWGMLFIGAFALLAGASGTVPAAAPPAEGGLPTATGMAMFLFIGFEWVTPLGRNPQAYRRSIPAAMLVAILALVVVYAVFATALAANFPAAHLAGSAAPQIDLASRVMPRAGLAFALILTLLAMLSSFNAGLMGASRLVYGLARDGKFPRWCASISSSTGSPVGAVLLLGGASLCAALVAVSLGEYLLLAAMGALIECIVYGALLLATLRMRATHGGAPNYRSASPRVVLAVLGVLIPALGFAAVASLPERRIVALSLCVLLASGAVLFARWAVQRQYRSVCGRAIGAQKGTTP